MVAPTICWAALDTRERAFLMKCTRHLCQEAPTNTPSTALFSAENDVAPIDSLIVQLVLGVEVRELPQTKAKPLILEIRDHLGGVRKPCLRELEVAAMGYLEPSGVYVDHITGDLVLTQIVRDVPNLLF